MFDQTILTKQYIYLLKITNNKECFATFYINKTNIYMYYQYYFPCRLRGWGELSGHMIVKMANCVYGIAFSSSDFRICVLYASS